MSKDINIISEAVIQSNNNIEKVYGCIFEKKNVTYIYLSNVSSNKSKIFLPNRCLSFKI